MADRFSNSERCPREMQDLCADVDHHHHHHHADHFMEEAVCASPVEVGTKGYKQTCEEAGVIAGVDSDEDVAPPPRNCLVRFRDAVTRVVHRVIPPGGIMASAFSLASGSIGAGILGLPGGTDTSGLGLAMMYLTLITFLSVVSMYLLAVTSLKTKIKTFEGLSRWLFPRWHFALSYWAAFVRWFYSFGACVGYVISVGDCFRPIFADALDMHPDNKAIKYFNTTGGLRLLQALVWLCIMLPLVVPKHIDSLRYASTFAVTMMTYFVFVIVIHSLTNGFPKHRHNVKLSGRRNQGPEGPTIFLFRTGNDAMTALGVFMFTYVCQINALEVLMDMRPEIRTPRNFTYATLIAMLLSGTLYVFVCIFGYFDFGAEKLQSNSILLMYNPLKTPYMLVAYVGVLVKLCVSYALLGMAARNSMYYIMGWQQKYANPAGLRNPSSNGERPAHYIPGDSFDSDPIATATAGVADADGSANVDISPTAVQGVKPTNDGKGSQPMKSSHVGNVFIDNVPMWQHLIAVGILAVICLMCGLFIPTIKIVFGFAGAIAGGFLAFIFPALFYMYSGDFSVRKTGMFLYLSTYALLLIGVVGVVFGTGASIYSTVGGK